jgi:hypothetical protein
MRRLDLSVQQLKATDALAAFPRPASSQEILMTVKLFLMDGFYHESGF